MYLLEDNISELMIGVSLKTKYKDKTVDELKEIINSFNTEGMYNYHYMLADRNRQWIKKPVETTGFQLFSTGLRFPIR